MNNPDSERLETGMKEDQHHHRARTLLSEWVKEINEVGMMSMERPYVRSLILQHLESEIVAECLVDLLAREFRKENGQ